ncbi:hypothetical protein EDC04DRAFT_2612029 [Pisolithus marmoratus]|nr:hypothetical protein EDC04DRAFT_2612029 [Pisolithus marmoratus]
MAREWEQARALCCSCLLLCPVQFLHPRPYIMAEEVESATSNALGEFDRWRQCAFRIFVGTPSLERLQEISAKNKQEWFELKSRLTDRAANANTVGALVVGATAAFLTTSPPTHFVEWDGVLTYCFLGAAVGFGLLSILSGFGLLVFLNAMGPEDLERAKDSRFKFAILIMLLTMPLTLLFVAVTCTAVAWDVAVWAGGTLWIKVVATCGSLLFIFIVFVIIAAHY